MRSVARILSCLAAVAVLGSASGAGNSKAGQHQHNTGPTHDKTLKTAQDGQPAVGSSKPTQSAASPDSTSQPAESQMLSLADRISGAVLGSLVSDSICLGSHYEYDATKIAKA